MIDSPILQSVNEMEKMHIKALRRLFSSQIKTSFLSAMLHGVIEKIGTDMYKYFNFNVSDESLVTGEYDSASIEYEICRYIVGTHRSNSVFLTGEDRIDRDRPILAYR